jgi:hypothetical protein
LLSLSRLLLALLLTLLLALLLTLLLALLLTLLLALLLTLLLTLLLARRLLTLLLARRLLTLLLARRLLTLLLTWRLLTLLLTWWHRRRGDAACYQENHAKNCQARSNRRYIHGLSPSEFARAVQSPSKSIVPLVISEDAQVPSNPTKFRPCSHYITRG